MLLRITLFLYPKVALMILRTLFCLVSFAIPLKKIAFQISLIIVGLDSIELIE